MVDATVETSISIEGLYFYNVKIYGQQYGVDFTHCGISEFSTISFVY